MNKPISKNSLHSEVTNISRRKLLKNFAISGLVLAVGLPTMSFAADKAKKYGRDAMPYGWVDDPLVFVSIAEDGTVTVVCHRAEMGQGVRTSLPMTVADEMDADWSKVKVVQADGDAKRYGNQDTDGSRSIRHFFMPMRHVGAAARMMLEAAAAAHWGVSVDQVQAQNHQVIHKGTGDKLGFGELANAASKLKVPERNKLRMKKQQDFRYIGKQHRSIVDGQDIVTGKAQYGMDVRMDGMVYSVIAHPPAYGDTLKSYDDSETMKVPGVLKVVTLKSSPIPPKFNPLGGVAVVATNTWAAIQGREKLKIDWNKGDNANYNSTEFRKELQKSANSSGKVLRSLGDAGKVINKSTNSIKAEYYIPHLAQAPMEPPVATAVVKDGKCEVWASTQAPQTTRDNLAHWLKFKQEQVTVHQTLLGGGFGRKSQPDYVIEAALVSKAMDGKPVKMVWTREDDIQHSYYHTVSVEHLEGAFDDDGKVQAWLHRTVAPSISSTFSANSKHELPFEIGMGAINIPFDIPNVQLENPAAAAHTRIGWFRSVSNIPHAFAIQSFIAEMANKQGRDHKEFLLDLIGPARDIDPRSIKADWNYGESPELYPIETGRLRNMIEVVTDKANWGKSLSKGRGQGLAAHYSFVSYVATVIEVEVTDSGDLSIPRVDIAIDCGPMVNPDRVRSQVEGACIMGISAAMLGEISFKNGVAEQDNFDDYLVTRMNGAPREINVYLTPNDKYDGPLGGVGETGMPPIAPALCNAIFAATGKRIRDLPVRDQLES